MDAPGGSGEPFRQGRGYSNEQMEARSSRAGGNGMGVARMAGWADAAVLPPSFLRRRNKSGAWQGDHQTPREGDMRTRHRLMNGILVGVVAGLVLANPVSGLEVGQKAPDFTLPAPGGKQVKLADLLAKGPVVIYTFIQAFTKT